MSGRKLEVRGARGVFVVVLVIGVGGLALAAVLADFRGPFALFVFGVAALLGLVGVLDRRVKLELSAAGIRHARWGPNLIPWSDFSGFRATQWRNNVYLQLIPRHPSYVLERFSALGRLNNRCARWIGSPPFSIAVTPLSIGDQEQACIADQPPTATPQWHALAGVRSVGVLDIALTMPARSSVANATHAAPLSRLATNAGERCRLAAGIGEHLPVARGP